MRKITFVNSSNGLSAEFSTDTPAMFLESFDGCSCGTTDIVYKPYDYDGQHFVGGSLNPRTVQFMVNFRGESAAAYSRSEALKKWDMIQRTFAPGSAGTLTWTDGTVSRFINVRCTELPVPKEILPFLFSASFSVVADKPLWLDSTENVLTFDNPAAGLQINNDCGIPVPVIIEVTAGADLLVAYNHTTGKGVGFGQTVTGDFVIDCGECTVRNSSGGLCSHLISVDSEYWELVPGVNRVSVLGTPQFAKIRWRKAYAGVY